MGFGAGLLKATCRGRITYITFSAGSLWEVEPHAWVNYSSNVLAKSKPVEKGRSLLNSASCRDCTP
jgi:hypothetical protein